MSDNEDVEGVTPFDPHEFEVPEEQNTRKLHPDIIKEDDARPPPHEQELPTQPLKPEDIAA